MYKYVRVMYNFIKMTAHAYNAPPPMTAVYY